MSGNPRITAAERRENERIRAERRQPRQEWAAFVTDASGKKQYVANPAHTDREFTEARASSKRFRTETAAATAAAEAMTFRRLRRPRDGEHLETLQWETTRRSWVVGSGVEQVK